MHAGIAYLFAVTPPSLSMRALVEWCSAYHLHSITNQFGGMLKHPLAGGNLVVNFSKQTTGRIPELGRSCARLRAIASMVLRPMVRRIRGGAPEYHYYGSQYLQGISAATLSLVGRGNPFFWPENW
ncbi:uncharacterized protein VTP21DRAFT_9952 [Calcarisporiella thermophila]|uniref:uncharacterized protein n=1 Tax=Calcarisporiella thermophila TaxID=911321 RepID=UPI0037420949